MAKWLPKSGTTTDISNIDMKPIVTAGLAPKKEAAAREAPPA
jgi:hypothetical protein